MNDFNRFAITFDSVIRVPTGPKDSTTAELYQAIKDIGEGLQSHPLWQDILDTAAQSYKEIVYPHLNILLALALGNDPAAIVVAETNLQHAEGNVLRTLFPSKARLSSLLSAIVDRLLTLDMGSEETESLVIATGVVLTRCVRAKYHSLEHTRVGGMTEGVTTTPLAWMSWGDLSGAVAGSRMFIHATEMNNYFKDKAGVAVRPLREKTRELVELCEAIVWAGWFTVVGVHEISQTEAHGQARTLLGLPAGE